MLAIRLSNHASVLISRLPCTWTAWLQAEPGEEQEEDSLSQTVSSIASVTV